MNRSYVNDDDVQCAMAVVLESFISTQKASVMKAMRKVRRIERLREIRSYYYSDTWKTSSSEQIEYGITRIHCEAIGERSKNI